jgi:hypothetical protein
LFILVAVLDKCGDGTVRWFTSPPIDVIDPDPIKHTQKYLDFIASRPQEMAIDDPDTTPSNEIVETEIQDVEMEIQKVEPSEKALVEALKCIIY